MGWCNSEGRVSTSGNLSFIYILHHTIDYVLIGVCIAYACPDTRTLVNMS